MRGFSRQRTIWHGQPAVHQLKADDVAEPMRRNLDRLVQTLMIGVFNDVVGDFGQNNFYVRKSLLARAKLPDAVKNRLDYRGHRHRVAGKMRVEKSRVCVY